MDPADGAERPGRPAIPLALALGIAALVAGAGLFELVADGLQRRAVAPRADWRAAAAGARRELRPGDLIVTAPEWADPLGRLVLGDRMTLDDVTRPDAETYGRILELSIRGARHPDTARATRRWRRAFGQVALSLWEQAPVRVATDFYARLGEAAVSEAGRPCTWEPGREFHDCGPGWKAVRRIRAEIGFAPRRCVLVLPQDGPARELAYPAAPLGDRIVVYTGLNNYDPRYRARRALWEWRTFRPSRFNPKKKPPPRVESVPVALDVAVDGRPVARLLHPVEDEGWRRHVIPVLTGSGAGAVRFTVSTRHAWGKHFCFHARAEGGQP